MVAGIMKFWSVELAHQMEILKGIKAKIMTIVPPLMEPAYPVGVRF